MSNSKNFQDTGMTSSFYQGVNSEQERIIKLLIYKAIESRLSLRDDEADVFDFAVALIKGEQK